MRTTDDPYVDAASVHELVAGKYKLAFARAADLAQTGLDALFEALKLRRSLGGYYPLKRLVELYCAVSPDKLSGTTYKQLLTALAQECHAAPRWLDKQMAWVIEYAFASRSIQALNEFSPSKPIKNLQFPMTVIEFAAEIRCHFVFTAMRQIYAESLQQ